MRLERFLEKATYYIVALAAVFVVLGSIAEPKIVRDVSVQKTFGFPSPQELPLTG